MIKEFCDNCNDELEELNEYTSKQSVKIVVNIESSRRDIPEETQKEFCSVSCAIIWLTKNKADFYHKWGKESQA
jgi:hypothetical protein